MIQKQETEQPLKPNASQKEAVEREGLTRTHMHCNRVCRKII
jgi:hypothetical protein